MRGLAASVLANLDSAPAGEALTGPVARGDVPTLEGHLAALAGHPAAGALYRVLSRAMLEVAQLDETQRKALGKVLGKALKDS